MASIDPLVLLQRTLASPTPAISRLPSSDPSSAPVFTFAQATHLLFPSSTDGGPPIVLDKTLSTRFKRTLTSPDDDTWDLQSLLLCYLRKDSSIAEYAQEAVKEGCGLVGVMQRKIVADYLDGRADAVVEASYIVPPAGDGAGSGPSQAVSQQQSSAQQSAAPSGQPQPGGSSSQPPAKKARYIVNRDDLAAYKRICALYEVRQISDRNTVLRGTHKLGNFASVRDLIAERLKVGKEELRKGAGQSDPRSAAPQTQRTAVAGQKRKRQANPIIIISPSSSALLTMYNIKRFLEESVFEPSDVARAASGRIAEDVLHINHKRQVGPGAGGGDERGGLGGQARAERGAQGEKLSRYFVVDGVEALSKFGDDAWDRVVCILTTGQEWQFRPYKWSEPKELFHHVKGIYVKWSNDPENQKIKSWNVSEMKIDAQKRHIDKSVVSDFWRSLEGWIATHKAGVVEY